MLVGAERQAFLADGHRRKVTHEAGHAVAAVARGGSVQAFVVPFDDFRSDIDEVGEPYVTSFIEPWHRPLVTYAGLWATARYWVFTGEMDDLAEAIDFVTDEYAGPGHDITKLQAAGIDPKAAPAEWDAELELLWPAMQRVAEQYIKTGGIDDATIARLVEDC